MTEWTTEPFPTQRITDHPLYMTVAGEHITEKDRYTAMEYADIMARPVIVRTTEPRHPWWKFWKRKANK